MKKIFFTIYILYSRLFKKNLGLVRIPLSRDKR